MFTKISICILLILSQVKMIAMQPHQLFRTAAAEKAAELAKKAEARKAVEAQAKAEQARKTLNLQDNNGWTALMDATSLGHSARVKMLLDHGAEPDLQSKTGETALMLASAKGHNNIVEILLTYQANPNLQNKYGVSALIEASYREYTDIVQTLLEHGADSNLQNMYGMTALMTAVGRNHLKIVQSLLDHGANPNLKNKEGLTALLMEVPEHSHYSTKTSNMNIVKALLDHGADPGIQDKFGRTALINAAEKNRTQIAQLLIQSMKDKQAQLEILAKEKTSYLHLLPSDIRRLSTAHLNLTDFINQTDIWGNTALINAVRWSDLNTAALLLKYGADPNIGTSMGQNALSLAKEKGNQQMINLLMKYRAQAEQEK